MLRDYLAFFAIFSVKARDVKCFQDVLDQIILPQFETKYIIDNHPHASRKQNGNFNILIIDV